MAGACKRNGAIGSCICRSAETPSRWLPVVRAPYKKPAAAPHTPRPDYNTASGLELAGYTALPASPGLPASTLGYKLTLTGVDQVHGGRHCRSADLSFIQHHGRLWGLHPHSLNTPSGTRQPLVVTGPDPPGVAGGQPFVFLASLCVLAESLCGRL